MDLELRAFKVWSDRLGNPGPQIALVRIRSESNMLTLEAILAFLSLDKRSRVLELMNFCPSVWFIYGAKDEWKLYYWHDQSPDTLP